MHIQSPVLGAIEVAEDKVIEFPAGLPGLEGCKRFALLHDTAASSGLFMLQSVDDPNLVLSVTGPENLRVNYEFSLTAEEVAALQMDKPEDVVVAIILSKDMGESAAPGSAGMRGNFMAPLVINVAARRGLQKIINKSGCEVTLRAVG